MTEKGCTREDSGEFVHATLDPKSGRCFNCSGAGHSRSECSLKKGNGNPQSETPKKVAKNRKAEGKGAPGKNGGVLDFHVSQKEFCST